MQRILKGLGIVALLAALGVSRGIAQDTNNNGIPDSWEIQYLGNLDSPAAADPGGVGRTLLQSYQQGLSPWPTPTVASGLQAWYRADRGVVADTNNNVSQWTDLSGSGYHIFQTANTSAEPQLRTGAMNGNPALQFTPQQVLTTPIVENLEAGGNDVTVIAVIAPAAAQGYASTIFSWGTDGNVSFGLSSNATNSYLLYWAAGSGNTVNSPAAVATAGQVQVLSEVKSGTAAAAYLNGAATGVGSVPATIAATTAALAMGNQAAPYYGYKGQVAEVLVYNRALSDTERHSIEAALTAKYINPDSNNNGIPDSWEMQYLGALSYGANADPGGVGRTLLQSFQQSLSPWPSPVVAGGLQAWYRADEGVVADANGNVSQWTDLSGNGYHVFQTVDLGKEPQWVAGAMNGNPAVHFSPQQVLATPALENVEAGGNDVTVIAVIAPAASQGYASTIFSWGTDGNVSYGLSSNATNSYLLYWGADSGNTLNTPVVVATPNQAQIISEVKRGTAAAAYLNGAATGTSTVLANMEAITAALAMGNQEAPYYGFTGQIAEVLVYNRALSDTERQSVEATLAAKYIGTDSNNNGIPDSWEMKYLGTLGYGANADPGGMGRTILESYQQGLSPWPLPMVAGGLQAWYRADKGVVADVESNVSQWTDVSGNGYHVFQTVDASKEPQLVAAAMNGNPAVQFTPQQVLTTPIVENLEAGGNDVTVIAVIASAASQGYASTIFSWGTDGNVAYGLSSNATNSYLLYWGAGNGNTVNTLPTAATAAQVQVLSEVKSGSAASAYLNGALTGTNAVPATMAATSAALAMGNAAYPYYGFTGQVAEVLVYNRALSDTERQSIEAALTAKYVNQDTNNNGIPDSWEIKYLGNLSYSATADPGGVGRTLLQSYQQGLSPWPTAAVATGLQAWYRADLGVVMDSNSNVTQWTDLSGDGYHVTQTVDSTKEPLLVTGAMNGQPAVQFAPQQVLKTAAVENLEAGGSDVTVIAVLAPAATQGYASTIFSWGTDGNVSYGLSSNAANSYLLYWGAANGNTVNTLPTAATAAQVQVLSEVKTGTSASAYLNGALTGTNAVPATMAASSAALAMGNAAYPYYGFTGQVAEVLVYNRALSDTERQSIEAALTAKYVNPDSNNNGIPDSWEMQYLGTLNYGANADPGGVGRTILQSYQQGLSPWPTPVVASGLQAWYRADKGVMADSNSKVTHWADLSGNGYHVAQTVDSTKEPLLVAGAMNGQPAVAFAPQQVLTTPVLENLEAGGADVTVIAVIAPAASQGYGSTIYSWGTDGNVAFGLSSNSTNSYLLYWGTDTGSTVNTPPAVATAAQVQVISDVKSGTTSAAYLNGTSTGTGTVPAGMAQTPATLAMGNAGYPYYGFTGQIAEVLVYNRALSDTERQNIEAQLTAKYISLVVPLPVQAGLVLDLRAEVGVVTDSNGNVSQWLDQSAQANIATPNTPSGPQLTTGQINGLPSLTFNGTESLSFQNNVLPNATAGEIIGVVRIGSNPGQLNMLWNFGTYLGSAYQNDLHFEDFGSADTNNVSENPAETSQYYIYDTSIDATGTAIYRYNGFPEWKRTGLTVGFGPFPLIGGFGSGLLVGNIAQVMVYNRTLTDAERSSIGTYLLSKYAFPSITAPSSPTDLLASAVSSDEVDLSWTVSSPPTHTVTTIQRETGSGGFVQIAQVSDALGYTDTGLSPGVSYTYQITIQGYAGTSGLSNSSTVTTPANIADLPQRGLTLWLRSTVGTEGSGAVSTWADQSGLGNNAVPVNSSSPPQLVEDQVNGLPVVRFSGANALNLPANMLQTAQAGQIIAIVKIPNVPNESNTLWNFGTGNGASYNSFGGLIHFDDFGSADTSAVGEDPNEIAQYYVYDTSIDTSGNSIYRYDGIPEWTKTGLTVGFQLFANIGGYGGGSLNGDIAEVIVYNRTLSPDEQTTVYAYLAAKYSLPAVVSNLGAPAITSSSQPSGVTGSPFSFQITATNGPTTYTATGLPDGLTIDPTTGIISGVPTAPGFYTVGITATNATGSGTTTLVLTISAPVANPAITSPATSAGQSGQAFSYQVAATNSPTAFSATGLPGWLAIDPAEGVISGVPAQAQVGTYVITVTASNAGGAGSAQLTITIAAAGSGPITPGMLLWLEGDVGIQTGTVNGVNTAVWADQSGQGNDASQSTVLNGSIQAPVTVPNGPNGHAVVHFTASSKQYLELPPLLSSVTGGDLFVVFRSTNSSGLSTANYWGAWTLGPNGTGFTNFSIADDFLSTTQYSFTGFSTNLSNFNLYNSTASPTQWSASINGAQVFGSSSNTPGYAAPADVPDGGYGTAIGVAYFEPRAAPTPTPTPTPTPSPSPTPPPDD